jgi:hypothetical protein
MKMFVSNAPEPVANQDNCCCVLLHVVGFGLITFGSPSCHYNYLPVYFYQVTWTHLSNTLSVTRGNCTKYHDETICDRTRYADDTKRLIHLVHIFKITSTEILDVSIVVGKGND